MYLCARFFGLRPIDIDRNPQPAPINEIVEVVDPIEPIFVDIHVDEQLHQFSQNVGIVYGQQHQLSRNVDIVDEQQHQLMYLNLISYCFCAIGLTVDRSINMIY